MPPRSRGTPRLWFARPCTPTRLSAFRDRTNKIVVHYFTNRVRSGIHGHISKGSRVFGRPFCFGAGKTGNHAAIVKELRASLKR